LTSLWRVRTRRPPHEAVDGGSWTGSADITLDGGLAFTLKHQRKESHHAHFLCAWWSSRLVFFHCQNTQAIAPLAHLPSTPPPAFLLVLGVGGTGKTRMVGQGRCFPRDFLGGRTAPYGTHPWLHQNCLSYRGANTIAGFGLSRKAANRSNGAITSTAPLTSSPRTLGAKRGSGNSGGSYSTISLAMCSQPVHSWSLASCYPGMGGQSGGLPVSMLLGRCNCLSAAGLSLANPQGAAYTQRRDPP